jgi:methionine synthase II (cobalamin-independent)
VTSPSARPPGDAWPVAAATGVGSLPGMDIEEAVRSVLDALPDFPHLPELPERGGGAEMIGRSAAVLADLHVDLQPAGWRLLPGGAGASRDERRAVDFLRRDLDALEEAADGYRGPLKLQLTGPWTLAAALELPKGGPALLDPGATRDVTDALADGLVAHLVEVGARVPGAQLFLQLDEPGLPTVLAGHVPTPSGFSVVPAVEESTALDRLQTVLSAARGAGAVVGVHCCAADPPLRLLHAAGVGFLSFDVTAAAGEVDLDAVGEAVEAGIKLVAGVLPGTEQAAGATAHQRLSDPARTVDPIRRLWRRLGFAPETLGETVSVSVSCGLAGATPAYARAAMRAVQRAAHLLADDPT